jgi:hypothetical protein
MGGGVIIHLRRSSFLRRKERLRCKTEKTFDDNIQGGDNNN